MYFLFAAIPMFLAYSATLIDPGMVTDLIDRDPQMILPRLVLEHMPLDAQVMFFGALLSAIMSSASGALLAPSVSFTENVLRPFARGMSDRRQLRTTRIVVACFTLVVLVFCFSSDGSIYRTVEHSYKITLVCGFVPLIAGMFWKRATSQGALLGLALGLCTWIVLELLHPDGLWPPHLAGLLMNALGMVAGSLAPRYFGLVRRRRPHAMF
jgi:Na+/proline symporter